MSNSLLFSKEELPRTPNRVRMRVVDGSSCMPEPGIHTLKFRCWQCGHSPGWTEVTMTEARRGIPCPQCNPKEIEP